jgi:uncharacterized peroxidase-related enzyme
VLDHRAEYGNCPHGGGGPDCADLRCRDERSDNIVFIEPADETAAPMYEHDLSSLGYVANYTRAFSHRPAVMEAWRQMNGAIKSTMDPRRYELATLAAALRLRSSYCSLAHGEKLGELGSVAETVATARDRRTAGLSDLDLAIMDFADLVTEAADSVTQEDIDRLRDLGLSDDEIFDVAAAASARCFFSKLIDAMGAHPDPAYAELPEEMVDVLSVGRSIADR